MQRDINGGRFVALVVVVLIAILGLFITILVGLFIRLEL
jgi:hypothetical protein